MLVWIGHDDVIKGWNEVPRIGELNRGGHGAHSVQANAHCQIGPVFIRVDGRKAKLEAGRLLRRTKVQASRTMFVQVLSMIS